MFQKLKSMRTGLLLAAGALLLSGCSTLVQPKAGVEPSQEDMAWAQEVIHKEVAYKSSLYHQAIDLAADGFCDDPRPLEPFILSTTGYAPEGLITDGQRVALDRLGMGAQPRVLWVDPTINSELKVGDFVTDIMGYTDFSQINAFQVFTRKHRYNLGKGKPLPVILADGRKLEVPRKIGCELGSPNPLITRLFSHTSYIDLTPRIEFAPLVSSEAKTDDELAWLAAFALYAGTSDEALSRRTKMRVALVAQLPASMVLQIIPFGMKAQEQIYQTILTKIGADDLYLEAAKFATDQLRRYGLNPMAGYDLTARVLPKAQVPLLFFKDATPEILQELKAYASAPAPASGPAIASK